MEEIGYLYLYPLLNIFSDGECHTLRPNILFVGRDPNNSVYLAPITRERNSFARGEISFESPTLEIEGLPRNYYKCANLLFLSLLYNESKPKSTLFSETCG